MALDDVEALYGFCQMNNWTSLSLKGCWEVSVPPLQYLHGQRTKKKAIQV